MSKQQNDNQQGIVAILVTMIIMIVLSLMATGFAQLARKEQREALDRQLANQAYYAAESGINDARSAIANNFVGNKETCDPDGALSTYLQDNKVGDDGVVNYSCLLINQRLADIRYLITPDESRIVPINAVNSSGANVNLDKMTISWTAQGGGVSLPSANLGDLPSRSDYGTDKVGMLRVDLIPIVVGPGGINKNILSNNMLTFFAYPRSAAASDVSSLDNGNVVPANCSTTCKITINVPNATPTYYVRLKSIYNPIDVKMCLNSCDGSTLIHGAQAEIDSTGKANDVLKRIKVLDDINSSVSKMSNFPEFSTQTKESICKDLEVWPSGATWGGC